MNVVIRIGGGSVKGMGDHDSQADEADISTEGETMLA